MGDRLFFSGIGLVIISGLFPSGGFSQAQAAQNRIPQQVVINGQMASGAYVTEGSQIQSFTCPIPQHYITADGSSQGWACYEQTTGVWVLNALPPAQADAPTPVLAPVPQSAPRQAPPFVVFPRTQPAAVYQQAPTVIYQQPPMVIYQQPAPTVVYAPAPPPVVVAPAYPSSVVLGRAAIDAAGRIASAVILNSRHPANYYYYDYYYDDRVRQPHRRDNGRRW